MIPTAAVPNVWPLVCRFGVAPSGNFQPPPKWGNTCTLPDMVLGVSVVYDRLGFNHPQCMVGPPCDATPPIPANIDSVVLASCGATTLTPDSCLRTSGGCVRSCAAAHLALPTLLGNNRPFKQLHRLKHALRNLLSCCPFCPTLFTRCGAPLATNSPSKMCE